MKGVGISVHGRYMAPSEVLLVIKKIWELLSLAECPLNTNEIASAVTKQLEKEYAWSSLKCLTSNKEKWNGIIFRFLSAGEKVGKVRWSIDHRYGWVRSDK